MYDIETIRQMNKDAGQNAMDQGLEPLKFNSVDMNNLKGGDITPIRSIPDLGDSVPNGWNINKRLGFGIVETGQFQVKIGVFEKMKKTMNFKVIFKKT